MDNIRYYLPGTILLLLAILIIAVPEILIAFIASVIIVAGLGALYFGHRIRKAETELRDRDNGFFEEEYFGRRLMKRSAFRNWTRYF